MPVKTTVRGEKETSSKRIRREVALKNLQETLKLGVKQPKGTVLTIDKVPLTEQDIKRIKKEIEVLKSKI